MSSRNSAKFVKSQKPGRLGVQISWCGYFVKEIKRRITGYRWEPASKTWFFDEKDEKVVRDLILESFPSEGIVIENIDGSFERILGKAERESASKMSFSQLAGAIVDGVHGGDLDEAAPIFWKE